MARPIQWIPDYLSGERDFNSKCSRDGLSAVVHPDLRENSHPSHDLLSEFGEGTPGQGMDTKRKWERGRNGNRKVGKGN